MGAEHILRCNPGADIFRVRITTPTQRNACSSVKETLI